MRHLYIKEFEVEGYYEDDPDKTIQTDKVWNRVPDHDQCHLSVLTCIDERRLRDCIAEQYAIVGGIGEGFIPTSYKFVRHIIDDSYGSRIILRALEHVGDALLDVDQTRDLKQYYWSGFYKLTQLANEVYRPIEFMETNPDPDVISLRWETGDILEECPWLTLEQARQVLWNLRRCHDASAGVTWETIRTSAWDLFGFVGLQRYQVADTRDNSSQTWLVVFTDDNHTYENYNQKFDESVVYWDKDVNEPHRENDVAEYGRKLLEELRGTEAEYFTITAV